MALPNLPTLSVQFYTGNLLSNFEAPDGIGAMCLSGVATAGIALAAPKAIYNMADLAALGIDATTAPNAYAYRQIKEFYDEVGGNQLLYFMLLADTVTMAQMLDYTSNTSAKIVLAQSPLIRTLAIGRAPHVGYNAGTDFMDADVSATVTAAKPFCDAQLAKIAPLRILIEGRVADETDQTVYSPLTSTSTGYCGVVLGGSLTDGSASIGTALGRRVKYPAHIKLGKVENGPLTLPQAYIGTKKVDDPTFTNLGTLHAAGYISFWTPPTKAGMYFGIDRMATNTDAKLLVYGGMLDKAAYIAGLVMVNQIEGELDLNADGTIQSLDATHLENSVLLQFGNLISNQVSDFKFWIDRSNNIVDTSKLMSYVSILPKGYSTWITIGVGLVASI